MSKDENKARSRQHYVEDFPDIDAAFPDREWTFHNQIAEGDLVLTHWTMRGTHTGAWRGIPATGKRVQWTGMCIHRIVAGEFEGVHSEHDYFNLMQHLGVISDLVGQDGASAIQDKLVEADLIDAPGEQAEHPSSKRSGT